MAATSHLSRAYTCLFEPFSSLFGIVGYCVECAYNAVASVKTCQLLDDLAEETELGVNGTHA